MVLALTDADNLTSDSFYLSIKTSNLAKSFKYNTYTGTGLPSYESWIIKGTYNTALLRFELKG